MRQSVEFDGIWLIYNPVGPNGPDRSNQGSRSLPAQQLVAAGEHVVDVPATLGSPSAGAGFDPVPERRTRMMVAGGDRGPPSAWAAGSDDGGSWAVLQMLAKRHNQLAGSKTQAASRPQAVLAALIPGGLGKEVVPRQAPALLRRIRPATMIVGLAMIEADEPVTSEYLNHGTRETETEIVDRKYPAIVSIRSLYDPTWERVRM